LTAADISPSLAACTPAELAAAINEPQRADVLVAHDASALRMLIPRAASAETPWICTYKVAKLLWPHADGYTREELIAWRGLASLIETVGISDPAGRAARQARMTALLLADLMHGATLNQLLKFSRVIIEPLRPAPDPADDAGWLLVPDDALHWIAPSRHRFRLGRARTRSAGNPPSCPCWAAREPAIRSSGAARMGRDHDHSPSLTGVGFSQDRADPE